MHTQNQTQNIFATEKVPNNAPNGKAPLDILTNFEHQQAPAIEVEKKPIEISKAMSNDGQSEEDVEMASEDKEEDP